MIYGIDWIDRIDWIYTPVAGSKPAPKKQRLVVLFGARLSKEIAIFKRRSLFQYLKQALKKL